MGVTMIRLSGFCLYSVVLNGCSVSRNNILFFTKTNVGVDFVYHSPYR